jgi:hypothetical protein
MKLNESKVMSGREVCPKCGKKGVGYANHPHALGWKDYGRVRCRYCGKSWKVAEKPEVKDEAPQQETN